MTDEVVESASKRGKSESTLAQLQQYTLIVADTGDFDSIRKCVVKIQFTATDRRV